MKKILIAPLFLLLCSPAAAQAPQAGAQAQETAPAPVQEKSPAEIAALRAAAKPLLDFVKAQSSGLSALKRSHAAARKQLRSQAGTQGGVSEKSRKALAALSKAQREEWRKAVAAKRTENDKFTRKNPEAEKALKELLRLGVPVREPGK